MNNNKLNQILNYKNLNLFLVKDYILIVELNRPKSMNALNIELLDDLYNLFSRIEETLLNNKDIDIRCIILKGSNNNFSSGLDLKDNPINEFMQEDSDINKLDVSRKAIRINSFIGKFQDKISSIEKCCLPVISIIDGYCIGGATSIISSTDIRICTTNSKFSVKEVDLSIAADIGVLQRMNKQVKNDSLYRQYVYTGEIFNGKQAKDLGLVSECLDTYKEVEDYAISIAKSISSKSPVTIWGIKKAINYSKDHNSNDALEYIKNLNSSLLQTNDLSVSIVSALQKKKPNFPKF